VNTYYMTFKTPMEPEIGHWAKCKATTLANAKKEADGMIQGYGIMFYIGVKNMHTERMTIVAKKCDSIGEWLDS